MSARSEMSGLIKIAGEKKGLLTAASLFSILSSLLQIAPFIAVYNIIEELLRHAQQPASIDKEYILYWGIFALIALIAALLTLYIGVMCSHIAAFNILYKLRVRLAEHVAKVPMGYHTKTATGELKKIIEVSVEKIEKFIAHQLPDTVCAVIMPILLISYLFWLDWRLALVLLIPIGIGFWLQFRMFGNVMGQTAYREFQHAVEEMNATGVEYVRGMPAVKVFGITADSFLTFKQAVTRYRDISLHITDLCKTPYSLFFVIVSSLFTFIIPIGILLLSGNSGNLSFAITFILFLIIAPSLSTPLLNLMYLGVGLREIVEGNKRIEAVFAEPVVTEPAVPQVPVSYDIAFQHVSFAYERKESKDFKSVLHDIDFVAKAGEMTALVGPSGGGKSTIANLLLRFWDVQEGEISIGGVPIREMGTNTLMNTVSFVFQDVHLFYDTIEANIRMGNTTVSKEAVIAASKTACCHEFIESLEQGYDTKIGEGGTYLSGGEAQRIAIARALLKNAPILVLDEATAYADAENEKKIQQGLIELVKGKTVLIIAHRLSTIRAAEQILVIKQGEIVERGTHDELRADNGLYEQMWQAHQSASSWRLGAENIISPLAIPAGEASR
ncbi:ABC transporter ATP-binding protein [Paenibacillus apiarius]|uniref:ABC transporter ATP-binding protein/permease n=1 Tax=Paenibacillus apiarius TaxID=46240 RepID=A0ABT4DZ87_9BACL|nr:ABC transporter ATP-binding protein [Paenibacillus apiarius]MCY9514824.1 ABC transporter ATP-binding protein/permease [Paenibacillus apiarius]MCY9521296.1 ABC transporter ATP-binding protein/permease [Paenibacillus apiarius]MCY9554012.1 ABC transporter ATP-binding protein/permease [Paenibacillus apiarius]MCY9560386.1 ABC transporter ATP-binding protein/permease [Paenibacillus apiarius]MCY9682276.1 ABC transporter ATP-binding protein/permease [Paenibacillus apiarius]